MSIGIPHPEDQLGAYRLEREIGRGAMGVVYEATTLQPLVTGPIGRRVALKLLIFPPLLPEGERAALIIRFAREARALAAVRHPGVVDVFEVGEHEGQPFLVMEYLAGLNAREWLLRHGPMPEEAVAAVGEQLCDALAAVHAAGIVHRDIKPDNVVLEADGSIRLTDFGIARMEVDASLTRTGGLIGSPAYMAPEQILGGLVDARADLFSTGVTLYQMLTGELPFQGSGIMEVAHRVAYDPPRPLTGFAPGLAAALFRAMEKDPARRFAGAAELRQALAQWREQASDESISAQIDTTETLLPTSPSHPPAPVGTASPSASPEPGESCSFHPQRPAIAFCAECEMPLCPRCIRPRQGRVWCPGHSLPPARPAWLTRLEVLAIGLLFALLLWSLYPLHW